MLGRSAQTLGLIASVLGLAACGSDSTPQTPIPDAAVQVGPDAMVTPGYADANPYPPGDLAVPAQGFQLKSPEILMMAGTEKTFCFYFTLPGNAAEGVKRWESSMTPGSHHLIVYLTPDAEKPDGTVDEDCSGFGGSVSNVPVWSYSSQTLYQDAPMPDGVGMAMNAGQHGYIQMHYLNASDDDEMVHVSVNGYTFNPGASYIKAAAFVTYNTNIDIPAGVGMTGSAEGTCTVPSGIQFFSMSTHSHRRSLDTWVKDGTTAILTSSDWEHPTVDAWGAPSFYTFSGALTYHCDYRNDLPTEVVTGNSAQTDEMCMAVGYFFPATGPIFCINSTVIPF